MKSCCHLSPPHKTSLRRVSRRVHLPRLLYTLVLSLRLSGDLPRLEIARHRRGVANHVHLKRVELRHHRRFVGVANLVGPPEHLVDLVRFLEKFLEVVMEILHLVDIDFSHLLPQLFVGLLHDANGVFDILKGIFRECHLINVLLLVVGPPQLLFIHLSLLHRAHRALLRAVVRRGTGAVALHFRLVGRDVQLAFADFLLDPANAALDAVLRVRNVGRRRAGRGRRGIDHGLFGVEEAHGKGRGLKRAEGGMEGVSEVVM
mmetsp:Transcript_25888/g.64681  ORF Transcript_25888/g.64681 Transcript_25888/m.64681 type:complete len:260 (-) Transcript_25888:86-865(-)